MSDLPAVPLRNHTSSSGRSTLEDPGAGHAGQAMAEFIVVLPVLLLLILGAFQFALVFMAKSTLNQAAFYADREGTLNNASSTSMKEGLASGLAPLYQNTSFGTGVTMAAVAQASALAAVYTPGTACIQVLNPGSAAFSDFGVSVPSGNAGGGNVTEIPNARLLYQPTTVGASSGEDIQDANLLKIRVNYCYHLIVPLINTTIKALAATGAISVGGAWQAACYANGGIPLVANSTMLMQSPAIQSKNNTSSCT